MSAEGANDVREPRMNSDKDNFREGGSPASDSTEPDEELPYEARFEKVWQTPWRTDEGIEAKAMVARSPDGYHACVCFASVNAEWDTDWGRPYATRQEAIDAATNCMDAWWDSQQERLLEKQEAEIRNFEKDEGFKR